MQSPPFQNCLSQGFVHCPRPHLSALRFCFCKLLPTFPRDDHKLLWARRPARDNREDFKKQDFPCVDTVGFSPHGSSASSQTCRLDLHKQAESQMRVILLGTLLTLWVNISLLFLATICSMWDLSSLKRDWTHNPPAMEVQSLNHWTTREVPCGLIFLTLCSSSICIILLSTCSLLPAIQDSGDYFAIVFIRVDK